MRSTYKTSKHFSLQFIKNLSVFHSYCDNVNKVTTHSKSQKKLISRIGNITTVDDNKRSNQFKTFPDLITLIETKPEWTESVVLTI